MPRRTYDPRRGRGRTPEPGRMWIVKLLDELTPPDPSDPDAGRRPARTPRTRKARP